MKKTMVINVRSYKKRMRNKIVNVSRHIRRIEIDVDNVTKAEYRSNFKKRSIADQNRDKSRTKLNAISDKTKSTELRSGWSTNKYDWIGIDAGMKPKTKVKMPKSLKHTESTRYDDSHYDKKAYKDSSLSKHENDELERERLTFRGMSHLWR